MRAMKDSGIAWIGEIPEEWELVKTRRFFSNHKQVVGEKVDKYERLALTMNGVIKRSKDDSDGLQPERFETYQILHKNELIFKLIDLENIKTSRVGLSPYTGLVSPAYIVLSSRFEDNRFFYYWFMFMYYNQVFNHLGGNGVRSALNAKDVLMLPVPNIQFPEQRRIADYLDRKCSQIDAIIARQQEVIEKLKAYKLSVITEAVTKGLNPHAPMKDSGVEWIGEIPEQWKVAKLKFVASFYNGDRSSKYPSGTDIVDEGVIFVTSNNLGNTFLDTTISTKYITKEKYDDLGGAKIRINDIIFCLRGSVGKCSINKSENEGTIASSLVVIRAKKILADYLIFALQCPGITAVSTLNAIGIGSLNLSADDISEIFIPIPPEKEAAEIAEFLYKRIGKIDHVINEKNNYVNHFVMYKKSLIYEVVTGKKEV